MSGSAVKILDELINSISKNSNINKILKTVQQRLYEKGFDIYHEFPIQSYNEKVVKTSDNLQRVPEFGRKSTKSILVGNTKYLWPLFINELMSNSNKWKNEPNPLNLYTLNSINSICDQYFTKNNIQFSVRFTFEMEKDKLISFQRLCHVSNYAFLDTNSYLCIHKEYGPWIALRAFIVLDDDYNSNQSEQDIKIESLNDILSDEEQANVMKQWNEIQNVLFKDDNNKQIKDSWKYWLKLRDSYNVGKKYRYSDDQILYHYTTDINVLKKICNWQYND